MFPKVVFSEHGKGVVGVVGHVGVGHVHSHSGFVQDDSGGFATVCSLLKEATGLDTRIKAVNVDHVRGRIEVETASGGRGVAYARRGITPSEAELMLRSIGKDGIFTQSVALHAFGRMYGQGAAESAVAFQAAVALAVADTFVRCFPGQIVTASEDIPGNIGVFIGAVLEIQGLPLGVLGVINATKGGIGPNEDLEGNVMLGQKARLMKYLGLDASPTIILEGKVFTPSISKNLACNTFLVRACKGVDNTLVGQCLVEAAQELKLPVIFDETALPRQEGALKKATEEFAQRIINLAEQLRDAEQAHIKVQLCAELAKLISEDAGGITFMSNGLHNRVRGAGMEPGTSAVLSLVVTPAYQAHYLIPVLTADDVENFSLLVKAAALKIGEKAKN